MATQRGPQFQGPLFHGTASILQPGSKVLPAVKHGQGSIWNETGAERGQRADQHAFATTSEDTAWHFASSAAVGGQRPRVYAVGPNPRMKPGAFHAETSEYIAPSFPVKERIDIKPGAQGTLTGNGAGPYNWNQHRSPGSYKDANHPHYTETNYAPEHGMELPRHAAYARNEMRTQHQDDTHEAWGRIEHRRADVRQPELFASANLREPTHSTNATRARAHDLRHLVNTGATPAHEVDHELAEAESHDSWNRSKGRRTNAVGRLQDDRAWRGR